MTVQANTFTAGNEALAGPPPAQVGRVEAFRTHLAAWIETCADYYNAAALYDRLSGLSDAELHRRGLSRATLARDVCDACASPTAR
jgi:hypothetical protein